MQEQLNASASYAEIHVAGHSQTIDGVELSTGRTVRIDLPGRFPEDRVEQILQDSSAITQLISAHPAEIADLLNAGAKGDLKKSVEIARRIGLTEERFASEGGGIIWWVVAAVVVVVVVATEGEAE